MPVHILLTKSDKLKRGPAKNALLAVKKELKEHERWISVQLFSSHNHDGMDELKRTLNWWLTLPDELDKPATPIESTSIESAPIESAPIESAANEGVPK